MGRFIVVTHTRRDQPPAEGNTATPPRYSREPRRRRAPEIRSLPPWRWRAAGITKYPIIGSISAMSLRLWGRYQFATPTTPGNDPQVGCAERPVRVLRDAVPLPPPQPARGFLERRADLGGQRRSVGPAAGRIFQQMC